MRIKKLLTSILVLAVVLLGVFSKNITKAEEIKEEKVYSNATIEDDFSDERVIVILNKKESQFFKEYSKDDFSEIKCTSITALNKNMEEKMQLGNRSNIKNDNEFRKIIAINLKEKSKQNVLDAIQKLNKRDDIYYVGPDYKIKSLSERPNDYYYNLNSNSIYYQWGIDRVDLTSAWNETKGSSNVLVGILDSGIDGSHPDLINRIETSLCRDFTSGSEIIVNTPIDVFGHGTKVAGVIGGQGNNQIGIVGVCWDVKLVSLKVLDNYGIGYSSNTILAIDFATIQNIPILNMSLGWYADNPKYNLPIDTAIENYPGLVVCAAGNEGLNNDNCNHYPSNLSQTKDNVISVAASDINDDKWYAYENASNYGINTVDLFAPGVGIMSTCIETENDEKYTKSNGTSMAAPFVTGVAALLLAKNPHLTAQQLKNAILNNVDEVEALESYCLTGGRLNARKALASVEEDIISYSYYNDNLHSVSCACMGLHYEPHTWELVQMNTYAVINPIVRTYACRFCGATKLG